MTDYKQHFMNGPIAMWIIDADTMQFLVVNDVAIDKYGYTRNEFRKMTIKDIRPEGDVATMVDNYIKKDNDFYDAGMSRHMKKDGSIFHVHIYCHSTRFGDSPARLCFAIDINDKVQAELKNSRLMELLKEQKEELDAILANLDEAIWSRAADTFDLIYANEAYYRMYGTEPRYMNPELDYILKSIYPPDRNIMRDAINEVKTTGRTETIYRQTNSEGNLRTLKVQATYRKGINNKPDIITGISTDITHEKELFDAMRNSEQKLLATINNTNDLIWSVDNKLNITYCNKAYQDFFLNRSGVALDAGDYVLGNWHSESFIAKRKKDYERALYGECFTTIVVENFNGFEQYNEIRSNPIIDQDGKIAGVNCIARDISNERKQLINIREQNEKLKDIARNKAQKVKDQVQELLEYVIPVHQVPVENSGYKSVVEQLEKTTENLDVIIKELIAVAKNLDVSFPDTEDIIARL